MFRHPPGTLGLSAVSVDRPFREPLARSVGHQVVPATLVFPPERKMEQSRHPSPTGSMRRKDRWRSSRRPMQGACNSLPPGKRVGTGEAQIIIRTEAASEKKIPSSQQSGLTRVLWSYDRQHNRFVATRNEPKVSKPHSTSGPRHRHCIRERLRIMFRCDFCLPRRALREFEMAELAAYIPPEAHFLRTPHDAYSLGVLFLETLRFGTDASAAARAA